MWTLWCGRIEGGVRSQPDGDRLVTAIHRDEVDVHVHEQIGLRRALGRARPPRRGPSAPSTTTPVGILRVVGLNEAVGIERVEHARPRPRGAARRAVMRRCRASAAIGQMSSTPAAVGCARHLLDDQLAHVGQRASAAAAARCRRRRSSGACPATSRGRQAVLRSRADCQAHRRWRRRGSPRAPQRRRRVHDARANQQRAPDGRPRRSGERVDGRRAIGDLGHGNRPRAPRPADGARGAGRSTIGAGAGARRRVALMLPPGGRPP